MLRLLLEFMGNDVDEAEEGKVCLEKLSQYGPDILMLDYSMPGMNGAQVAEKPKLCVVIYQFCLSQHMAC